MEDDDEDDDEDEDERDRRCPTRAAQTPLAPA
jgi:hypothetical protein